MEKDAAAINYCEDPSKLSITEIRNLLGKLFILMYMKIQPTDHVYVKLYCTV